MGERVLEQTLPLENSRAALLRMSHWLVPSSLAARLPWSAWLVGAVLLAAAGGRRLWRRLAQPALLAAWLPGVIYFIFVLFTANTLDSNVFFYDRYQAPLLPLVTGLLGAALQELAESRILPPRPLKSVLLLLFALWLAYPGYTTYKYVRASWEQGETSYNQYNTRRLQEAELARLLRGLEPAPGQVVYSNYPAAAWFYTRRQVRPSPRVAITEELEIESALAQLGGWPAAQTGYLAWFLPNEYDHVLPPEALARLAEIKLLYAGKEGRLYAVGESLNP